MTVRRIHHVAYRCRDAEETVRWYEKHLDMRFVLAIAEDRVPSTHAPDPYMHLFLDAGGGNILAFFELPNSPAMGRDPHTPEWVQHIALKVDSVEELGQAKTRLEAAGIPVVGVTDHTIFKSIYFFDPNGHRIELAADTATPEQMKQLDDVKWTCSPSGRGRSAHRATPRGCTSASSKARTRPAPERGGCAPNVAAHDGPVRCRSRCISTPLISAPKITVTALR